MVREGFGQFMGPVETGVEAELHLATSPWLEGVTGEYFDRMKPARANDQAYNEQVMRKLWQLTGAWVRISERF